MAGIITRTQALRHGGQHKQDNHGKDKGRNYNRFANPDMALVSTSSSSDLMNHGNGSTLALAKSSSTPALGADLHWMQARAFDANGALDTNITLFPPSRPSAANLPKRPEYRPTIGGAAAARMRDEAMGPTIPDNSRLTGYTKARGRVRPKQSLEHRLVEKWDKDEVLYGMDTTIEKFAERHGGYKALVAESQPKAHGGERNQELAILDKMRKDEEGGLLALPVEQATIKVLSTGVREYIDYAVDEVERFANVDMSGAVTAEFDWAACGDFFDVPALRRSGANNRVDGPAGHISGFGRTDVVGAHEGMFGMDFLRDFCIKSNREPHEDEAREKMEKSAHQMLPKELHRADDGSVLFKTDNPLGVVIGSTAKFHAPRVKEEGGDPKATIKHEHMSAMHAYLHKSPEEIRWEDYQAKRVHPTVDQRKPQPDPYKRFGDQEWATNYSIV